MARRKVEKFSARLRTVPLVLTCERQSEYPDLSDREENYLSGLFTEFSQEDTKRADAQNTQRGKGTKIQRLLSRYAISSIYNYKTDEIIVFYKDLKPPKVDEAVAVMGEKRRWLVKKATISEAIVEIRVPITASTDLDHIDIESKRFASSINGYRAEDDFPIEEELREELLRELCRQHHVGFPYRVFRKTKRLQRIKEPKYKPMV